MESKKTIITDYLVIGAGAMGMAFADEIINMSGGTGNDDTEIVLVDRRANPGGHWNDAYGFVRLHQPSYMGSVQWFWELTVICPPSHRFWHILSGPCRK